MDVNLDMTFCRNKECKHTKCMRYWNKAPKNTPVSMAMFGAFGPSRKCEWRFDDDWETVEVKNKS